LKKVYNRSNPKRPKKPVALHKCSRYISQMKTTLLLFTVFSTLITQAAEPLWRAGRLPVLQANQRRPQIQPIAQKTHRMRRAL
jgi:hypothetical protein